MDWLESISALLNRRRNLALCVAGGYLGRIPLADQGCYGWLSASLGWLLWLLQIAAGKTHVT
jgi:hypothetical protein